MYTFRNSISALSRSLPYFRGKRRLGIEISRLLTNYTSDQECITTVQMRDGSLMQLDVRSGTEQWSYWTGDYDNSTISKLSSCLKEQFVVFDIGANIGFYSVALGRRLKALNGIIYAVEPVKTNFDRLTTNILLNNLGSVVLAHNIALGDEEGTIEICMANDNNSKTGNAVIVKGKIPDDYFDVRTKARITKLDIFAKEYKIEACHLIKIDIEGAEVMFLRGATSFLSQHRPIIYGEFNNFFMPKFGCSFLDVVDIVAPWDYRFFKQTKQGYFIEVKQPEADLENVLLAPSEISNSVLTRLGVIDS